MIQRVLTLAVAVGFVAAAFLLIPADERATATLSSAPAGEDPPAAEAAQAIIGDDHEARDPGATSDETAKTCDPLVNRLRAWGGEELAKAVGMAAIAKYDEATVVQRCAALFALSDDELRKAVVAEFAVEIP